MAIKRKAKPKAKFKAKAEIKSKTKQKNKLKTKAKITAKTTSKTMKEQPASPDARFLMRPLEDRIIVRVLPPPDRTAGGLIIPVTAGEQPSEGDVIATGPGRRNKKGQLRPLDVRVGDKIVFAQYSGTQVSVTGREFLILREEDVLGIVT